MSTGRNRADKTSPGEDSHRSVFSVFDGEHRNLSEKDTEMQNEKKAYETPEVTLVRFEASARVMSDSCNPNSRREYMEDGETFCWH